MVLNWIMERIFSPERVKHLIEKNQETINDALIETFHTVLEDEDLASHVVGYTDGIYDRYLGKSGKLWGSLGGRTKGLNFQVDQALEENSPLGGIEGLPVFDEDGKIQLTEVIKSVALRALFSKGGSFLGGGGQNTPNTSTNTPIMSKP